MFYGNHCCFELMHNSAFPVPLLLFSSSFVDPLSAKDLINSIFFYYNSSLLSKGKFFLKNER